MGAIGLGLFFSSAATGWADDVPPAIKPASHMELFNGKDFSGWTFFMKDNADPAQTWSIEHGVIKCTGKPLGYMRTQQDFRDYRISVEWRFVRIAPHADNTGVFVHIQLPDKIWPRCVECQGQYGRQGDLRLQAGVGAKDHPSQETKGVGVPMVGPSNEKPVGEWNTCEAVCTGSTIRNIINGKQMNEITGCSISSGKIGLQSEGGNIEIRRVFLDPLPPESSQDMPKSKSPPSP